MTDDEQDTMRTTYEDWRAAKVVIEQFLRDIGWRGTAEEFDHNSSALLARLAAAEPPLLTVRASLLKEDG